MNILTRKLFQPIRNPGFTNLFLATLPLLTGVLVIFISPSKLDSGDFFQIAWNPGRELLATGSISAAYPYQLWTVLVMLPFIVWPLHTAMILWLVSNKVTSTLWGLFLSLGSPWIIPVVISVALMGWLGWIWLPFLRGKRIPSNRILFLFSAAILINLIVVPYSWMHNLALMLLPAGYCVSLSLKINNKGRYAWLVLLFIIMQPLMLGLFMVLGGPDQTQAYQIIPALMLLPIMCILEYRTVRASI